MQSRTRWAVYAFLGIVLVPALGFAAWVWITLSYSYSTGERAGQLQKISSKGWVCKTWEGEIAMPTQPGVPPQIFTFSVRDEAVARQLLNAAGQRVSLSYEQHVGVPTQCFGETEYYITRVQVLGN
ncbi:MAG: hypothetical protein ACKV2U_08470 [Bryobacteraceae bacterium]